MNASERVREAGQGALESLKQVRKAWIQILGSLLVIVSLAVAGEYDYVGPWFGTSSEVILSACAFGLILGIGLIIFGWVKSQRLNNV